MKEDNMFKDAILTDEEYSREEKDPKITEYVKDKAIELYHTLMTNKNVFLTGGPGRGKTTILRELYNILDEQKYIYKIMAPTHRAAEEAEGKTFYAELSLDPTRLGDVESYQELYENSEDMNGQYFTEQKFSRLKNYTRYKPAIFIFDEVSMIDAHTIKIIFELVQYWELNVKFLFVGDFKQLSPPKKNAKYAFEADEWSHLVTSTMILEKPLRNDDLEFIKVLDNISNSSITVNVLNFFHKHIDDSTEHDKDYIEIVGTNKKRKQLNREYLDSLKTETRTYRVQVLDQKNPQKYTEKYFEKHKFDYDLELAVGSRVVFQVTGRDEDGSLLFANGMLGTVASMHDDYIMVETDKGERVRVSRLVKTTKRFDPIKKKKIDYKLYGQFPIALARAMTTHKLQGSSINNIIIHLDDLFTNGHFYTAVSRLKKNGMLKVKSGVKVDYDYIDTHKKKEAAINSDFLRYLSSSKALATNKKVLEFYKKINL